MPVPTQLNLGNVLESIKGIRLTGGIFGKTLLLLIVLSICVSAVVWRIGNIWFGLATLIPLMALIFYATKRCFDFATRYPQAAIMEGAELLSHERLIHGMKGKGQFVAGELEIDHSSPRVPVGEDSDDDTALEAPLEQSDDSTRRNGN